MGQEAKSHLRGTRSHNRISEHLNFEISCSYRCSLGVGTEKPDLKLDQGWRWSSSGKKWALGKENRFLASLRFSSSAKNCFRFLILSKGYAELVDVLPYNPVSKKSTTVVMECIFPILGRNVLTLLNAKMESLKQGLHVNVFIREEERLIQP